MDIKILLDRVKSLKLIRHSPFTKKFDKEAYKALRLAGADWSSQLVAHKEGTLEHEFYEGKPDSQDMEEFLENKISGVVNGSSLLLVK